MRQVVKVQFNSIEEKQHNKSSTHNKNKVYVYEYVLNGKFMQNVLVAKRVCKLGGAFTAGIQMMLILCVRDH